MNRLVCLYFIVIFFCAPILLHAQSGKSNTQSKTILTTVQGHILDKGNSLGLEQVTVKLLSPKDSSLISGAISGKGGVFSIPKIKIGNYIIEVSYVGYEKYTKSITVSNPVNGVSSLPIIKIGERASFLKEAVVVGQQAEMVVKKDTIEYNSGAYKLQESAVVEDLLKRLPGVDVDQEGKVKVKGKEVTKIMIDGKEMFKGDPTMSTKNIPVEIVDKLQVIDDKSELSKLTGIDDGEEVTVINLTIKKGMKKGWNINASAGVGTDVKAEPNRGLKYDVNSFITRMDNDLNLTVIANGNNINNQRSGRGGAMGARGINSSGTLGVNFANEVNSKLSMGGNVRYGISEQVTESKVFRENLITDNQSYQKDTSSQYALSHRFNFNYRILYKPNEKQTFEIKPSFSYNQADRNSRSLKKTFADLDFADTINYSNQNSKSNSKDYSFDLELDFAQDFNKKGRRLSVSLDAGYDGSNSYSLNNSKNVFLASPDKNKFLNQQSDVNSGTTSFKGNVSYVEPIANNKFLQLSYALRYNDRENIKMTYDLDFDTLQYDYSKSLRNKNLEQIIGISFRGVAEKYQYTLGVDLNPTYTQSSKFIEGVSPSDIPAAELENYFKDFAPLSRINYAPNINYTYRFTKDKNLRIDYRGRMRQPSITQLDPTEDNTNPLSISSGNPNLLPTYTNALNATFNNFNREQQRSLSISLRGNYVVNDIVTRTTLDPTTGIQERKPENKTGTWDIMGIGMYNIPIGKRFQINSYTQLRYANAYGYTTVNRSSVEDISRNASVSENLGLTFRLSSVFMQLRANGTFQNVDYSVSRSKQTFTYGGVYNIQVTLPYNWSISSDVTYNGYSGYSSGYNQQETLWNAEVSKMVLKGNRGTVRLRVNDILQQRLSISRTIGTNYIQDEQYNALRSYVMVSFAYRFNSMGKNASRPRGAGGDGNNSRYGEGRPSFSPGIEPMRNGKPD